MTIGASRQRQSVGRESGFVSDEGFSKPVLSEKKLRVRTQRGDVTLLTSLSSSFATKPGGILRSI